MKISTSVVIVMQVMAMIIGHFHGPIILIVTVTTIVIVIVIIYSIRSNLKRNKVCHVLKK